MSQEFNFRFTLTKEDFISASRSMTLQQRSTIILLGILGSFVLFAVLSTLFSEDLDYVGVLCGILPTLLIFSLMVGYVFVFGPMLIGRRMQKSGRCTSETIFELNEQVITAKDGFSEWKTDWGSFKRVVVTKDYYLLVYLTHGNMAVILPKRAIESTEQDTAFKDLLRRKGMLKA